jgi:hypothetical protein
MRNPFGRIRRQRPEDLRSVDVDVDVNEFWSINFTVAVTHAYSGINAVEFGISFPAMLQLHVSETYFEIK